VDEPEWPSGPGSGLSSEQVQTQSQVEKVSLYLRVDDCGSTWLIACSGSDDVRTALKNCGRE
jgi:hypothetical protein